MNHIAEARAADILAGAAGKRIAVLGDFMLDRHLKGVVRRISPEAPVPVVEIESESTGLGGAGNVVHNLARLGARPFAFGVVGDDAAGEILLRHLREAGADVTGMLVTPGRRTTEKMRIIAHDQHVVRADRETVQDLARGDEEKLLTALADTMPRLDAIILEDYNKGVLTSTLIPAVLRTAREHTVPVAVDPKLDHFFDFKGVHLFKPNVRELESALGCRIKDEPELLQACAALAARVTPELLLLTRGEKGMLLFENNRTPQHIPTRAMKVHDVSGAGDTVIATFVVAEAGGASPVEAAILANYAAGIVCGEVGVVPIEKERLLAVIAGKD